MRSSAIHVQLSEEVVENQQYTEGTSHRQTRRLDPAQYVVVVGVELEWLRRYLPAIRYDHGLEGEVIGVGFHLVRITQDLPLFYSKITTNMS